MEAATSPMLAAPGVGDPQAVLARARSPFRIHVSATLAEKRSRTPLLTPSPSTGGSVAARHSRSNSLDQFDLGLSSSSQAVTTPWPPPLAPSKLATHRPAALADVPSSSPSTASTFELVTFIPALPSAADEVSPVRPVPTREQDQTGPDLHSTLEPPPRVLRARSTPLEQARAHLPLDPGSASLTPSSRAKFSAMLSSAGSTLASTGSYASLPPLPPLPIQPSPLTRAAFDLTDLELFLHSPLPLGAPPLRCRLLRDRTGIFSTRYTFCIESFSECVPAIPANSLRAVLYAQRKPAGGYLIAMAEPAISDLRVSHTSAVQGFVAQQLDRMASPKIRPGGSNSCGELKSNFAGNKYVFQGRMASVQSTAWHRLPPPLVAFDDPYAAPDQHSPSTSTVSGTGRQHSSRSTSPANAPPSPKAASPKSSPRGRGSLMVPSGSSLPARSSPRGRSLSFSSASSTGLLPPTTAATGSPSVGAVAGSVDVEIEYEMNRFNSNARHLSVTLPPLPVGAGGRRASLMEDLCLPPPVLPVEPQPPRKPTSRKNSVSVAPATTMASPLVSPSPSAGGSPITLQTNQPRWISALSLFLLNFGGRAPISSLKNMQLIRADKPCGPGAGGGGSTIVHVGPPASLASGSTAKSPTPEEATIADGSQLPLTSSNSMLLRSPSADPAAVLLQLGKCGAHEFNVDVRHPLTPIQAFVVSLTAFDFKLAVE